MATPTALGEPRRVTRCWTWTLLPKELPAQAHDACWEQGFSIPRKRSKKCIFTPMKPMRGQAGAGD